MTRLAVTAGLDAWDIPALRFGVAGLIMLPVIIQRGLAFNRLGWLGFIGLITGTGAPYVLVVAIGLRLAPAYDAGALNPGCMPLFVALITASRRMETFSATQKFGLALILVGALLIVGWHGSSWDITRGIGDVLFLCASFLTACYTVVLRRAQLEPVHATALVSTGSMVVYFPFYIALRGFHFSGVTPMDLIFQVVFQGIVVTIISLLLYARAVAILGASRASAFGALVPALSGLFAIPLLAEWPTIAGWTAVALISCGVYLASRERSSRR